MARPANRAGAKPAAPAVEITEFTGLVTNSDPHDLPPGASPLLVNATPVVPGQLTVRRGTAVVRFDT